VAQSLNHAQLHLAMTGNAKNIIPLANHLNCCGSFFTGDPSERQQRGGIGDTG